MAADVSPDEANARSAALDQYCRWLVRRSKRLDLTELADLEPIELRQIFVPLRLGPEDLADEAVEMPSEGLDHEALPGEDVWKRLAEDPFLVLSGRPGSGKTTLVQAIVSELAKEGASPLRRSLGFPVPILLRLLGDLEGIESLEELLARWWPIQEAQAEKDKMPLDRERLEAVLFPREKALEHPVLLLFDGIDEIGGSEIRGRLIAIAREASRKGCRILITGRPDGYRDLQLQGVHHLQPLAGPQIRGFIERWYKSRDGWRFRRKTGVASFLAGIAAGPHLLTLARRPVFLTLMALVHGLEDRMPAGRVELYEKIVDIYLARQERHRQRNPQGDGIPDWPAAETRAVLAHVAWVSQDRAAQVQKERGPLRIKAQERRIVWSRDDLEAVIRTQLTEGPGRFIRLRPDDVRELVDFYLHPAGLLVSPAEGQIQFAHLSLQEYLCAWHLHARSKLLGESFLKEQLFQRLRDPGWDEVGLRLLAIHAEDTQREGHFELMRSLDLGDPHQAELFVTALTGGEVPFSPEEQRAWLPAAVAAALLHPVWELGKLLGGVAGLKEAGGELLLALFQAKNAAALWKVLADWKPTAAPGSASPPLLPAALKKQWMMLSKTPPFGPEEERASSLVILRKLTGWAPIGLEVVFERWLKARIGLLWGRFEHQLPFPSSLCIEMDVLLSERGFLWRAATEGAPLDLWLLLGELELYSPSFLVQARYPEERIGPRTQLALSLVQSLLLLDSAAGGPAFRRWCDERERLLSQSSRQVGVLPSVPSEESQRRLPSRPPWHSLSRQLALTRADDLRMGNAYARFMASMVAHSIGERSSGPARDLKRVLESETEFAAPLEAFATYSLRQAARSWFAEQAADPDLARRRGLRLREPIPRWFELVDATGRLPDTHRRSGWLGLRSWLDNDDAVLAFVFPKGLAAKTEKLLRADLEILRGQPWSPQSGIDAMLQDWPESEEIRDISLEAADAELRKVCEEALARLEREEKT